MATVLEKELIRETGLSNPSNNKGMYVILYPDENGGNLAFREEGKCGKEKQISLKQIMESLFKEDIPKPEKTDTPTESKDYSIPDPTSTEDNIDNVCLAELESTIMIQDDETIPHVAKIKLWDFIREIREVKRVANNMKPLAMHRLKKGLV